MEEVEGWEDRSEYGKLAAEKDQIEDQLKGAVGLGGKDRKLAQGNAGGKAADRVRKALAAVTGALPRCTSWRTTSCGTSTRRGTRSLYFVRGSSVNVP